MNIYADTATLRAKIRQRENKLFLLKCLYAFLFTLTLFIALVAGLFYGLSNASGFEVKEWPSNQSPFEK